MKKILVTGSDGQLGMSIQKMGKAYPEIDFYFTSSETLDITQKDQIEFFFEKNEIDYCINCAAYTNVEQAEKAPEKASAVNAIGVKKIAEVCKSYNTVLIHISTDYVFDGQSSVPYSINDIPNPINEYGKSKLKGEQYIQEILSNYFIIRTSWLYNKEYGKNFYRTILEKAQKGEELRITTGQTGCPTNTNNLAEFILNLIESKNRNFGIHHFTDKEAMTWYDFAKQILLENKLLDKTKLVKVKNYRTFAARPKNSVLINL